MILRVLAIAATAAAVCVDDPFFLDENGNACALWANLKCSEGAGLSSLGVTRLLEACQFTCNSCVKANDFCEIGLGGDVYNPSPVTTNFDFVDQPFITTVSSFLNLLRISVFFF